jgi:hypothetical protein
VAGLSAELRQDARWGGHRRNRKHTRTHLHQHVVFRRTPCRLFPRLNAAQACSTVHESRVPPFGEGGSPFTPKLDIRHLGRDDPAVDETMEGCIWLFQQDKCHRSPSSAAKVICRLEVVRSLLQTVRTLVVDVLRLALSNYADPSVYESGSVRVLRQHVGRRRP